MANVTAAQLKQRLAELLEIPKKQADEILWAYEQVMVETVKNGDTLTIPGIGKLESKVAPARKARNPRTGETIMTKPKVTVKFKVSKSLKDQAPAIKSKQGKALLADAEEKQQARDKAKRKRERNASKETTGTKKNKKSSNKKSSTKSNSKKSTAKASSKKKTVKAGRRF